MKLARLLLPLGAGMLIAGCYESNQSRPRSATSIRTRQTDNGAENVDTTSASRASSPGGNGRAEGGGNVNPKTGKP